MAFVINKSKVQSAFQVKVYTPGPGAYQIKDRQQQQRPAPFNSSANKVSYFDIQQTKYGPGSYNTDNIKAIKQTKIAISSSFNSKVQRFKTQPQQRLQEKAIQCLLSPQNLQNCFKQITTQLQSKQKGKKNYLQDFRKTNYERKVDSIHNNKEFIRVMLSNPSNNQLQSSVYIDRETVLKTQTGPGKYDIQLKHKGKSVICWSNDKQKRFKRPKSKSVAPGPGQYEVAEQQSHKAHRSTSSFSYGGVRSFMDNIIYKTNIPIKAKILQYKQVKDRYPGPGQYSPQKFKNESFYCGDQLLGSGVQRFKDQKKNMPGPGSYKSTGINQDFTKTVRETRKKIFGKDNSLNRKYSQTESITPLIMQQKDRIKAQDQRLKNYCSLKQRCSSKFGSLAQQERFKDLQQTKVYLTNNKGAKVGTPGPGQYQVQNLKTQNKFGSVFNSKLGRQVFKGQKQEQEIPYYNVEKHDIGNKAKKIKNNIQNLKKVFIQMVPFNSSSKRMLTETDIDGKNQIKYQKSLTLKDYGSKVQPLQAARTNNTFCNKSKSTTNNGKKIDEKCSSSFKSSSNRQMFISKSFNNLGPGSYNNCKSLDKKSFNSQYNEELVQRMNIYGQPRSRTCLK